MKDTSKIKTMIKNNNISNGKNDEAQTHAQISVKLRYINSALNDNFRG